MKNLTALLILASFFLASCEEEPLPIVMEEPIPALLDTTYITTTPSAPQPRRVLFEEFTGVRCVNCPNGHAAVKSIIANYPGRIAAIAVHDSGEFNLAKPFAGEEDYNTNWGTNIFTIISKPNGIPYGIADRTIGSNTVTQWETNVVQQMNTPTVANAWAKVLSFDATTRELRFEVKFELTSAIDTLLYFSTAITEDSLIGKQEYQGGYYNDYVHLHVLRDMPHFKISLNPGQTPSGVAGRVFLRQYSYTLPPNWKAENCRLIAYIHEEVKILQTAEIHIQ